MTVDNAILFLNSLLALDRNAVQQLVDMRVTCNSDLADHPTVQCGEGPYGTPVVGLLGVLNGFLSGETGFVAAIYADDGTLTHFEQLPADSRGDA